MKLKKTIPFICFLLLLILYNKLYISSAEEYNEGFQIKSVSYKISLIETASEMYLVNSNESSSYEDMYKNSSKQGYIHYKWLTETYESMDSDMKKKLSNIFRYNTSWDYINEVIYLNDNALTSEILYRIITSENLDLNPELKDDINIFFTYFSNTYFYSYFNKHQDKYINKALDWNKIIADKNINLSKFIKNVSGESLSKDSKIIFYYDFNPIQSQVYKNDNTTISTIQLDTNIHELISIAFYHFSHYIFDSFGNKKDFLAIYDKLLLDKNFTASYNKSGKGYYDFDLWCKENLVTGFSKYLDYRFFQFDSNLSSYAYDLDFYKYLRKINFNPRTNSLEKVCLEYYNYKLENSK